MKLKVLFLVVVLAAAMATISIAATSPSSACVKVSSLISFDYANLILGGNSTTNGDGDPVPGGGIPR